MVLPSAEPSLPRSSRPVWPAAPAAAGAPYRPPVPPPVAGPADVATSGTPAPGVQPVGSLGGPGALKLPVGRVKLDITPAPDPRPPAPPPPPPPRAAASVVAASVAWSSWPTLS